MALAALVVLVMPAPAVAQEQPASLSVSGAPEELTIDRGATASTRIVVRNPADYPQDVQIELTGLTIRDGEYSMEGPLPSGMQVTTTPQTFTLAPKTSKDVAFRILIAVDAEAGGSYGGIIVRGIPKPAPGQSAIVVEIALPLLVTVPGDVTDTGKIRSFGPEKPEVEIGDEVTFTLEFENTGNVHYPVTGNMELFIGPRAIGVVDVPRGPVLPGTTRKIPISWTGIAPKGTVRAELSLIWGKDGQYTDTRTSSVELVVELSPKPKDDGGFPIRVPKGVNTTIPSILGLLILLFVLALHTRATFQRDRAKRS